jgi:hypothetical protein
MANNNNVRSCRVFTAQTRKIENGEVAVERIVLTNVATPLLVLFAYGGGGAKSFEKVARDKEIRLAKTYPEAEIRIIKGFLYPHEFKAHWTKLYDELTQLETACKYALWQIHYFGHGGEECFFFIDGKKFFFNESDNMEPLPWHPYQGIFVLHSCRSAAYEDTLNKEKIKQQLCLAKTISEQQKTRCLGQVTYANYTANMDQFNDILITAMGQGIVSISKMDTTEQDAEVFKYRSDRISNSMALASTSCALWGYALLTGKTHTKTLKLKADYEKDLAKQGVINPIYPIYEEIKKLGTKNQILPCRVFNDGKLETRIVEIDVFNQNDLEYL